MDTEQKKKPYRKPQAVKDLEQRIMAATAEAHPTFPQSYVPRKPLRDDTANGLTQCIIKFLTLEGAQAERINTMGRVIMQPKHVGPVVKMAPKYIPTNGTKGSADISATIQGRSVKIEVKVGRDRQREDQRIYQAAIERAGGLYVIAHDFTQFLQWYNLNFQQS